MIFVGNWIVQQILLKQLLEEIGGYLKEPILIHGDSSDLHMEKDTVIHALVYKKVMVSTKKWAQPQKSSQTAGSAIITGEQPHQTLDSLRRHALWNGRLRTVIIVTHKDHVKTWISTAWRLTRAVNVLVAVLTDPPTFYTWFPYKAEECTNVSTIVPVTLDNLFPQKIKTNLQYCNFTAVTNVVPPFVFDETHGLEPRILKTIADKLNLSFRHLHLPVGQYVWLRVLNNEPVNGLKWVWENKVDIVYSHLDVTYESLKWSEMIPSYFEDSFSWAVPSPEPVPRSTALFRAFPKQTWLLIAIVFFSLQFLSAAAHIKEKASLANSLIRIFSIQLNIPTNLLHSKIFSFLFIVSFLYSFHIITAYQASLITFLSETPREAPINTLQELADSNFGVILANPFRRFVNKTNNEAARTLLHPNRVSFQNDLPIDKVAEKKYATICPGLPCRYLDVLNFKGLFKDEYDYPTVLFLSEPYEIVHNTMYLSPGHPLVPILSRYTQYLIETGFPEFFLSIDSQPFFKSFPRKEKRPFGVENVQGAFTILCILLLVSMCLFMIELISKYFHYKVPFHTH